MYSIRYPWLWNGVGTQGIPPLLSIKVTADTSPTSIDNPGLWANCSCNIGEGFPHKGMDLLCLFWGGSHSSTNRPHWLISNHHITPVRHSVCTGWTRPLLLVTIQCYLLPALLPWGEILACGSKPKVGGSGGMLPQENFEIYDLWDCYWWLLRPCTQVKGYCILISSHSTICIGNF